jgi:hypothetical protein
LELAATDLVNNNANGNGFLSSVNVPQVFYSIYGNLNNTYYLLPGTQSVSSASQDVSGISFAQTSILFQGKFEIVFGSATPNTDIVTLNIYYSTTPDTIGTLFESFSITKNGVSKVFSTYFRNKALTLSSNTYLQVETVSNTSINVKSAVLSLDFY